MEATVLSFSKPLHVSSPQAHKPTILNLRPNNASILNSSFYGESFQILRGEMSIRDCSWMPSLGGPGPEIVAFKGPLTGRRLVGKNRRVPSWRSLTLESLRGGTASLEVLLDAKKARLDPQFLDDAESKFQTILSQDPIQFHELKRAARKLEMRRKEDAAVQMLSEALEGFIREGKSNLEIYEVKLVLVEMLIYQGDYERARQTCIELHEEYKETKESTFPPEPNPSPTSVTVEYVGPTDYKLQFYQAVICVLLGEKEKAKKHWDEFNLMTVKGLGAIGPLPHEMVLDAKKARLDPQFPDNAESEFQGILSQQLIEFHKLKEVAGKLEMSGKEDAAVKMLNEAVERLKEEKRSQEIYGVKLLLVELLMYKGDYEKARETCKKLQEEYNITREKTFPREFNPDPTSVPVEHVGPTDYKLHLYQAILCALLGESQEAKKHWDEFNMLPGKGLGVIRPLTEQPMDEVKDHDEEKPSKTPMFEPLEKLKLPMFESLGQDDDENNHQGLSFPQFEDHINVLRQEIEAARN